jgi:hypothetical protein
VLLVIKVKRGSQGAPLKHIQMVGFGVVLALGRLKQEKFEISLGYVVNLRSAWDTNTQNKKHTKTLTSCI